MCGPGDVGYLGAGGGVAGGQEAAGPPLHQAGLHPHRLPDHHSVRPHPKGGTLGSATRRPSPVHVHVVDHDPPGALRVPQPQRPDILHLCEVSGGVTA